MIQVQSYKAQVLVTCVVGVRDVLEVLINNWDNCQYISGLGLDPIDSQSCSP